MEDSFVLTLELSIFGNPHVVEARSKFSSLEEVNARIFEFVKEHGASDTGSMQTITMVLVSSRK